MARETQFCKCSPISCIHVKQWQNVKFTNFEPSIILDMWYVNADGMEGWVPSDVLRLMVDDDFQSSGQSTPMDMLSAEVSADNSEVSDDGKSPNYIETQLKSLEAVDM